MQVAPLLQVGIDLEKAGAFPQPQADQLNRQHEATDDKQRSQQCILTVIGKLSTEDEETFLQCRGIVKDPGADDYGQSAGGTADRG